MRRLALLSTLALLLPLGACGDGEGGERVFRLDAASPTVAGASVPFRLGVLEGTAVRASSLRVSLTTDAGGAYAFEVVPGSALAFAEEDGAVGAIRWPGEDNAPVPGPESLDTVRARFEARDLPAEMRAPASAEAFVVDVGGGREDALGDVIAAATARSTLRFLLEVRPAGRYATGTEEPPAGAAGRPLRWAGSEADFDAFKEAEVAAWRAASAEGRSFVPSDDRHVLVPRVGSDAREPDDFLVLAWPAEERWRFDGRMLQSPRASHDMTGRPILLYDVHPDWQNVFGAFTEANVGLPLAIVVDDEVLSAPVIRTRLDQSIQVTFGAGQAWAETAAMADHLALSLGGEGRLRPTRFVAWASWGRDGAFRVAVPLPGTAGLTVTVEATDETKERRLEKTFPLRFVAGAPSDARHAVPAAVVGVLLDRLEAGEAAATLRAWMPQCVERLAALMASDPSRAVKAVAADLVARVDRTSPVARDALLAALRSDDAALRFVAARAIGFLEPDAAQQAAVLTAVGDGDKDVKLTAMRTLVHVGGDPARIADVLLRQALADDVDVRRAAHVALSELLPEIDAAVEAAVTGAEDEGMRAAAVNALGMAVDEKPRDGLLIGALRDPSPRVRASAVTGLLNRFGVAGDEVRTALAPHLDVLRGLLADPSEVVRGGAAALLAELGPTAEEPLLQALSKGSENARLQALAALLRLEDRSAAVRTAIVEALGDESVAVRCLAGWGVLGGDTADVADAADAAPDALRTLAEAMKSDDPRVQALTANVMQAGRSVFPRVVGNLRGLLGAGGEETRQIAAALLERLGAASEKTATLLAPVRQDPHHPLHHLLP